jgi:hypothetical protein
MNPVQVVEAARPEVGTMPAIDRRHLRERIFDVAMRSQTDHAPVEIATPNTRAANALRLAALGMLGAIAIAGLLYSASRETPGTRATATPSADLNATGTSEPTLITIAQAPALTVAPTTTMPPVAGSGETPLLLPPERNRLDALTVTRAQLGASALLLRAPDLSTISLFEVDGLAPVIPVDPDPDPDPDSTTTTTTTIAPRQFAAVSVEQPDEDSPGQYQLEAPCGTVTVLDVTDQPEFRPELTQLFDAMRIVDGVIDISLPAGWGAISTGPSTDEFVFGLPVNIDGRNVTLTLAQYPGGSIALAGNDQLQYSPATFNGQPAWLHRDADDPNAFDLITMVGTTAIRVSTSGMSLSEAETVITGLAPGDVDEWTNRFGALPVDLDPDIRTCPDQPEFRLG